MNNDLFGVLGEMMVRNIPVTPIFHEFHMTYGYEKSPWMKPWSFIKLPRRDISIARTMSEAGY